QPSIADTNKHRTHWMSVDARSGLWLCDMRALLVRLIRLSCQLLAQAGGEAGVTGHPGEGPLLAGWGMRRLREETVRGVRQGAAEQEPWPAPRQVRRDGRLLYREQKSARSTVATCSAWPMVQQDPTHAHRLDVQLSLHLRCASHRFLAEESG